MKYPIDFINKIIQGDCVKIMKDIPEGIEFGDNLILVGDCTKFLKGKIEETGKTCIHVEGCPPGEPLPYWALIDRKNQPNQ